MDKPEFPSADPNAFFRLQNVQGIFDSELPWIDRNKDGAIDRKELAEASKNKLCTGMRAEFVAALDENFDDIAANSKIGKAEIDGLAELTKSQGVHSLLIRNVAKSASDQLFVRVLEPDMTLAQARKAAHDLQEKLSKRYGISFAENNELMFDAEKCGSAQQRELTHYRARTPNLVQLMMVERALARSSPANFKPNLQESLKLYFAKDSDEPKEGAACVALYTNSDKDDRPALIVFNDSSLQADLMHEIVHNEQDKMNWGERSHFGEFSLSDFFRGGSRYSWLASACLPVRYSPADFAGKVNSMLPVSSLQGVSQYYPSLPQSDRARNLAEKMGWRAAPDGTGVCFQTKDGQLVRPGEYSTEVEWDTLDPRTSVGHRHFSSNQMRQSSIVRPGSAYFPGPEEMHAEATQRFRESEKTRKQLRGESTQLYQIVKAEDQIDINNAFGLDNNGSPKVVRYINGLLVKNSSEIANTISLFENGLPIPENPHLRYLNPASRKLYSSKQLSHLK